MSILQMPTLIFDWYGSKKVICWEGQPSGGVLGLEQNSGGGLGLEPPSGGVLGLEPPSGEVLWPWMLGPLKSDSILVKPKQGPIFVTAVVFSLRPQYVWRGNIEMCSMVLWCKTKVVF